MYRIVIVDDNRQFRERLTAFISTMPHCTVISSAETAEAGFDLTTNSEPDVALVDIGLPGENGFWLAKQVGALKRRPRVVLMSDAEAEEYEAAALQAGAIAYLPKREISERLPDLLKPLDDTIPTAPPPVMPNDTRDVPLGMSALGGSNQLRAKSVPVGIEEACTGTSVPYTVTSGHRVIGQMFSEIRAVLTAYLSLFLLASRVCPPLLRPGGRALDVAGRPVKQ